MLIVIIIQLWILILVVIFRGNFPWLIAILALVLVLSLTGDTTQEGYRDQLNGNESDLELSDGTIIYYDVDLVSNQNKSQLIIYNSFDYSKKQMEEFLLILKYDYEYSCINVSKILNEWGWHDVAYEIHFNQKQTASVNVYFDSDDVGHGLFSWVMNNIKLWRQENEE